MKRFILIFVFSAVLCAFGQTDSLEITLSVDSVPDIEEINIEEFDLPPMEMIEESAYSDKDYIRYMCFFSGVDFGLTSIQNEKYPLKQQQSFAIRFNLVEFKKQLVENRFGIFSGISLGYQQIGFQDNFTFVTSGNQTVMESDSLHYLKNQLRSFSISVPFMLEINSKNTFKNNVHFAFGLQEHFRYANSTYQMHKTSEATIIRKNSENIHVNPFNLEACVRVGFQNFTFFASRSLTPLFSTNKFQTEIYPIVVGLCIIPSNGKPSESDNFDF